LSVVITANPKPVKQEVNGIVILPLLVFPGLSDISSTQRKFNTTLIRPTNEGDIHWFDPEKNLIHGKNATLV
jgi:hypothetical protein